jgi:glutathione S-transferase
MIKLYGSPLSNYVCMVKTALIEKQIPFEMVAARPSQDPAWLAMSSMGKIPCIQTDSGYLAETRAILDYLEESSPTPALLPADPFARAKVRELAQSVELYLELVARKGYGFLFGREVPESAKAELARDLPKGLAAVGKLVKFSPWIAGEQFTYADLVAFWSLGLAQRSAQMNAGVDLLGGMPGSQAWFDAVATRDSVRRALADQDEARKAQG